MGTVKKSTTAYNRPGKPSVTYSACGYDEFRAALEARLKEKQFMPRDGDMMSAFVDLTAYLGEVLMTYQNAYAQEVFLDTAQLRESVFDLAAMVDYRISPGSAASVTIIFSVKPGKNGEVPKRFLVSGKEEGAKEPVFFETDEEVKADSRYNELKLADSERFEDIRVAEVSGLTVLKNIVIRPGQYICAIRQTPEFFAQVQSAVIDENAKTTVVVWSDKFPDDAPLKVGDARWGLINNEPRGLLKVAPDANHANQAEVWLDNKYEGLAMGEPFIIRTGAVVYYGYVKHLDFEYRSVKTGSFSRISKPYDVKSDNSPSEPNDSQDGYDSNKDRIKGQYDIVTADGKKRFFILERNITEMREVSKVTVEWFGGTPNEFSVSNTEPYERSPDHIVFAGVQTSLPVRTKEEKNESLTGSNELVFDGDLSGMEKYRTLVLHQEVSDRRIVEEAKILGVVVDTSGGLTKSTIELDRNITGAFTQFGVAVWGNAVRATQGKTAGATLGSGRGEIEYQSFELPRQPLTFERKGREGLKGAIDIKVDDLQWRQMDDFLNSAPGDRHYIISTGFDGKSSVIFGDGLNGSRVPTGMDNVVARFRTTQGYSGNVPVGVLNKPASKPPFLEALFNAEKASGGTDPDREGDLRKKIPTEHITFGRAVSLLDYSDLALSYPGIAKAKAGWRWMNKRQYVVLAVAGADGSDVTPLLKDLRKFMDARRDFNQPLILKKVSTVPVFFSISAAASRDYESARVEDAVWKALGSGVNEDGTPQFFNFNRLDIGMSIHKKDIYFAVESIPGVETVTKLEITRQDTAPPQEGLQYLEPSFCAGDVWINNWELAEIDLSACTLTVTQPAGGDLCERSGG